MAELAGPYELLDLPDGGVLQIHPTRWEEGTMVITPTDGRVPRQIPVLRVHVRPEDKRTLPSYWDITAKTAMPTLLGVLPTVIAKGQAIRLSKFGVAPKARFTVDVVQQ